MGNAALKIKSPALYVVSGHRQAPKIYRKEVYLLAALLVALQVVDGLFTAVGIHLHGIEVEANILLRHLMYSIGTGTTLFLSKSIAILIIIALARFAEEVIWIPYAMKAIAVIYVGAAIVPWSYVMLRALL